MGLLASDAVDRTRSMNCDTCMGDGIRSERLGIIPRSGIWARAVPKDSAPREPHMSSGLGMVNCDCSMVEPWLFAKRGIVRLAARGHKKASVRDVD